MSDSDSLFDRTVRIVDQRNGKIPLHSRERPCSPTTGTMVPDNHIYGELQYLNLLEHILKFGNIRGDRTGTGTHSIFGPQMTFDISNGRIPLLTTKKVNSRPIIRELLWFLSGSTNNNDLDAKIWNQWATGDGDLGPIYGKQWRSWDDTRVVAAEQLEGLESQGFKVLGEVGTNQWVVQRQIDQVQWLMDELVANPDSRRLIISAWNPTVVPVSGHGPQENVHLGNAALAACHTMVQFYTRELSIEERVLLSMQRQNDIDYSQWMAPEMDTIADPDNLHAVLDNFYVPRRSLSSKLYQR